MTTDRSCSATMMMSLYHLGCRRASVAAPAERSEAVGSPLVSYFGVPINPFPSTLIGRRLRRGLPAPVRRTTDREVIRWRLQVILLSLKPSGPPRRCERRRRA